jgi:hypothetical protein
VLRESTVPAANGEITFRLGLRTDRDRDRSWLVISVNVGGRLSLELVPNSVATRSVISPEAYQALRAADLIGLDVFDFRTGRVTSVLRNLSINRQPAPDLTVQVRDVPELLTRDRRYLVDGYLGLDYLFFGDFGSIEINTRALHVTLRLDSRSPLA